jgi:hypothetical protein
MDVEDRQSRLSLASTAHDAAPSWSKSLCNRTSLSWTFFKPLMRLRIQDITNYKRIQGHHLTEFWVTILLGPLAGVHAPALCHLPSLCNVKHLISHDLSCRQVIWWNLDNLAKFWEGWSWDAIPSAASFA